MQPVWGYFLGTLSFNGNTDDILVDQFEDTAKIYKLHQGKFIKLIDVSDETISFELSKCQFDFEFSKIWK